MRRIFLWLLAALLLAPACGAAAAEIVGTAAGPGLPGDDAVVEDAIIADGAGDDLQVVSVPEQGFSTRIPANCAWSFNPDGGLAIELGASDDAPWINIFRTEDTPGSAFDCQTFFDEVYTPQMQDSLGDALLQVGNCVVNNIAGIEMTGVQYTYLREGRVRKCLCMFDLREDGFVQYEAYYYEDEQDRCLLTLALAAINYQPDPDDRGGAPEPRPTEAPAPRQDGGLGVIQCPEMGFETMYDTAGRWKFTEGQGVYIYAPGMDDYSFAVVYRDAGRLEDAGAYLREQDMPFWKQQFGQDFISYTEYERYALGGRALPAMVYAHSVDGVTYEVLRVIDERDGNTVIFSAQYPGGAGEIALRALEIAAANYRTLPGAAAPTPQPTDPPAPRVEQPPASPEGAMAVDCPEQGFSTVCDPANAWRYVENEGVYIYVEQPGYIPFALVARFEEAVGDGATYIRETEVPAWQAQFGDSLVDCTVYDSYTVGGRQLPAVVVTHRQSGFLLDLLRVVDARADCTVVFAAHYIQGEGDAALAALDMAAANYREGGGAAPQPQPEPQPTEAPRDTAGLSVAACPELGFSTLCDPSVLQEYQEGNGLCLYVEGERRIPYVLVFQNGNLLGEPFEYLREQYTPHMREKYGDDLVRCEEYEAYAVGGRQLPAALYTYRVDGRLVDLLRVMDSTGAQTVTYTAKYIQGEGDATLAALDAAVAHYRPDASYYGG